MLNKKRPWHPHTTTMSCLRRAGAGALESHPKGGTDMTIKSNHNGRKLSRRTAILRGTGIFTAALFLSTGLAPQAMAADCKYPAELTFAIVPTEESVAELQLYQPITKRLAKETG